MATFECTLACSDVCVLVDDTPQCECSGGYQLNADGLNCDDVNECEDTDLNKCGEPELCSNTPEGSYTCACSPGATLASDGRACKSVS